MREIPSYFRAQHGEPVRKSRAQEEVPYLAQAIDASIYKEGDLVGQGIFLRHGEIFQDVLIWNPRKVKQDDAA